MNSDSKDALKTKILEKYKDTSWIHRNFTKVRSNRECFRYVEKEVPKKGLIVDLGCGHGYFSHYLALASDNRNIIGIDVDINKIKAARRCNDNNNIKFYIGDIKKIKIPPADAFVLLDVLFYIPDKAKEILINDIFKKLKKNGLLIIKESTLLNWFRIFELYSREILVTSFWRKKPSFIFYYKNFDFWKSLLKKFNFSKVTFKKPTKKGYVIIVAEK
jgi:SAM-dependent methyltransferase